MYYMEAKPLKPRRKQEAMTDIQREQIEQALEAELGFRWTPQMRHGHKALKLWEALVNARVEIERLRAIADAVGELPIGAAGRVAIPRPVISDIMDRWFTWKNAAEAAEKEEAGA